MLALLALCIFFSEELVSAYIRPRDWWHDNLRILGTFALLAAFGFVLLTILAWKLKWRLDSLAYAYKASGILVVTGTWIGYLLADRLHKLLLVRAGLEFGIWHLVAGTFVGLLMIIFGIFLERKGREFE